MLRNVFFTKRWVGVALINFCIVAAAGVVMRYKINFPLPAINHKFLMYAHSNFAFTGWVAIILMTLMVRYLVRKDVETNYRKYNWILGIDVLVAYGMFVLFLFTGYGLWSNILSIVSILISYIFIFSLWKDLNKIGDNAFSQYWLKAALGLWSFSSLGAFTLAYLLANRIMIADLYFASLYFFLHFQYNGWFLFVCFGIFFAYMRRLGLHVITPQSRKLFWIMLITVVPTFFLSLLWLKLPVALQWVGNISGVFQLLVLIYFFRILSIVRRHAYKRFHGSTRWIWTMVSIAFILKIILQLLSIIPYLSHFAFGFRPVIIGYLHLSFVGIISLFVFGYINEFIHRFRGRVSGVGAIIFVFGFIAQEIILMFQGLEAMNVEPVQSANILLYYCAILQLIGLVWITTGIIRNREYEEKGNTGGLPENVQKN